MVKPTPTPVPAGGYETPSAGINWKLFLLVVGIAGIALAVFALLPSGEKNSVSADIDGAGADVGQSGGADNLSPVTTKTETPDAEPTATKIVTATETFSDIKTIYVDSASDLSKMKPGILYVGPAVKDNKNIEHYDGYILLEKDKLVGTVIPFRGTNIEIKMINGIYYGHKEDVNSREEISSWIVVYKLPWVDSDGKPILSRTKLVEFDQCNENFDGKYVLISISN